MTSTFTASVAMREDRHSDTKFTQGKLKESHMM
ncbi:hypothetical protein L914_03341 [Phytophthora nicotianae]|uniref:Uncharacterized protein n=1 Tax=Phytophthora nicotianae TaxID=4792 RepID=W2NWP4_PHYNI|nr:hypothetical protein L914_03341 [Phytophthora nicotianae]